MFHMDLSQLLPSMRDALLPANHEMTRHENGERSCKAIVFDLQSTLTEYVDGEPNEIRLHFQIMFFGNTSVFFKLDKQKWSEAVNHTNHDSCWRSMEFLSSWFFECCREINEDTRPIDINQFTRFSIFKKPFTIGTVVWKMDEKDKHNYRRKVVSFTGD